MSSRDVTFDDVGRTVRCTFGEGQLVAVTARDGCSWAQVKLSENNYAAVPAYVAQLVNRNALAGNKGEE